MIHARIGLVDRGEERGGLALAAPFGGDDAAIAAIKEGAYDYLPKPFRADEVLLTLRKAAERERLAARLAALPGMVRVFPSDANFLFCCVRDAKAAYEGLTARGVLVKLVPPLGAAFPGGLRITVGTPAEHDVLVAALREGL